MMKLKYKNSKLGTENCKLYGAIRRGNHSLTIAHTWKDWLFFSFAKRKK